MARRYAVAAACAAAVGAGMLLTAAPASALPKCDSLESKLDADEALWDYNNTAYNYYYNQLDFVTAAHYLQLREDDGQRINDDTNMMRQAGCFGPGE